jgi:adenylate cyclase
MLAPIEQPMTERRLAAIFAADVVGFSELMDYDELGTLRRFKDRLNALISALIAAYGGRLVKLTGDGVLAEFRSVIDTVSCAIAVQRGVAARNGAEPAHAPMVFRIGINVGDIIVDGSDIYGNGVNVAARLESLSDPGGLCLSAAAMEQITEALPVTFLDRGDQFVKNIPRPIRVFALTSREIADVKDVPGALPSAHKNFEVKSSDAPHSDTKSFATAKALPRMSIVVLPFDNFSNDSEQGFFADGVTEDLTTDLSRIAGSFVIARNTAYAYRDKKTIDVRQLGQELGVRYVLEGSVRRSDQQVRLNAQLIETETGAHIWADRFDGERQNLAAIQNEVTGRIARALNLELVQADGRRALRQQALGPQILDHIALGRSYFHKPYTVFHGQETRRHFQAALDADPDAVEAMTGLAMVISRDLANAWAKEPERDIALVADLIRRSLDADSRNPDTYYARGMLYRRLGRIDDGIAAFETGLDFDPNHYLCLSGVAFLNYFGGNSEYALVLTDNLFRISPRDPNLANMHWVRGSCHVHLGDYKTAITHLLRARRQNDQLWFIHYTLAAAYALSGAMDDARRSLADMQRLKPEYKTIARVQQDLPYLEDPRYVARAAATTHRGLEMAGLPLA